MKNTNRIIPNRIIPLLAVVVLALTQSASAAVDALSLVPADAITVGSVRFVDLRTSSIARMLFTETDKIGTDGDADRFLKDAGLQPSKDIDVLVVATSPTTSLGGDVKVLIAADGRFDVERLSSAIAARGGVKQTTANGSYYLLSEIESNRSNQKGAVAFVNSRLVLLGSESAVTQGLTDYANGGTRFATARGLGQEFSLVDAHATAWALIDVPRASRLKGGPHMPSQRGNTGGDAIASAVRNLSTVALWATDTGDALKVGATGLSRDEETRGLLEDTLRGMLAAWRLAVQDKSPELVSVLRKFSVTNNSEGVTISGSIPTESIKALKWHDHATAHAPQSK
jgi:hypothetical protein